MTTASQNDVDADGAMYPRNMTISTLFAQYAAATPGKIALVENDRSVTYGALDAQSSALAARLQAAGVGPGDIVAVLAQRSIETVSAMLAVLKAGAVFAPLDPAYPAERLAFMLADAEPKMLLVQAGGEKALEGLDFPRARVLLLGERDVQAEKRQAFRAHPGRAEDGAYLIYTSGSTGAPKGVLISHRALIRVVWRNRFARFDNDTVALHIASLSFDASQYEIWGALLNGGTLAIVPDATPSLAVISQTIKRDKPTWTLLTTGLFHLMVDHHLADLAIFKTIFVGGDVLSAPHADRAARALPDTQIVNAYGPTENGIITTYFDLPRSGWTGASVPIGGPIEGDSVYIVDENLNPVADGAEGELCAAGDGLAIGYHRRAELTREKFVTLPATGERVYRTGDMARRRPDGMIEFAGRRDRQVKINGKRVELDEIEWALRADEAIRDAIVIVREDAPGIKRVAAYLIPQPANDEPQFTHRVLARLRERVPAHLIPNDVVELAAFPLTAAGKVDRAALPAPRQNPTQAVPLQDALERQIAEIWAAVLGLAQVGPLDRFFDLGGTSLMLLDVQARISKDICPIDQSVLFEAATVRQLAVRLRQHVRPAEPKTDVRAEAARRAAAVDTGAIAIVGMAGRFPGANTLDALWNTVRTGAVTLTHFSEEELEGEYPAKVRQDSKFVKARPILDQVDQFDAPFFGMQPREAAATDPQHRLFLECAWEALEDASIDPERYDGAIGVFAGAAFSTYMMTHVIGNQRTALLASTAYQLGEFGLWSGGLSDFLATRVAYKLNLRGPAITVQSACSTSLLAVAQACQSLQMRQSDVVLAGGVSISFPIKRGYLYQQDSIVSPDGRCRPFDEQAAGTVFGCGVGVVTLKRLDDALRDGDHIYSVIRGAAVNNDGSNKVSFSAPSPAGQARVIATAHAVAGIDPRTIEYVECHGTATPLGDPIEFAGLKEAFGDVGGERQFCALGSVKANLGHLDAAAGVVGLIKATLSLHNREIPPMANYSAPNPRINLPDSPFYIPQQATPWQRGAAPRRAGVSAFGMGGTNVHVVLEEAPASSRSATTPAVRPVVLPLSAQSDGALQDAKHRLADHLEANAELGLSDVALTLLEGRRAFSKRTIVAGHTRDEIIAALRAPGAPVQAPATAPRVIFMFPGQGAQYPNMGRELYEREPLFREIMQTGAAAFAKLTGKDLLQILYGDEPVAENVAHPIRDTALAQPALFLIEYAVARLWLSWGVQPAAMIGHSIGEFVAACLSGVMSFDEALSLVTARGALMQAEPAGAMLSVRLSEAELRPLLGADLDIAAINGPKACVASGSFDNIAALEGVLTALDIAHRRLHSSHAFHSRMMAPVVTALTDRARAITFGTASIPWMSCVTGDWIDAESAASPEYWGNHCRAPVKFAGALARIGEGAPALFIECGPGRTLATLAAQVLGSAGNAGLVTSLPDADRAKPDDIVMAEGAGRLWAAGIDLDWRARGAIGTQRVALPTYAFQRQRHWIDAAKPEGADTRADAPIPLDVVLTPLRPVAEATPVALRNILSDVSGSSLSQADDARTFLELGFDSLSLSQVAQRVQSLFAVDITFRKLINDLPSINALAAYLDARKTVTAGPPAPVSDRAEDAALREAPLTEAQREIWLLAQMGNEASCTFNESVSLQLDGALDAEALTGAINDVVARHDALRARFSRTGEGMIIADALTIAPILLDFADRADREQALESLIVEDSRKPYSLTDGPLVRAHLVRMAPQTHVLVIGAHHLIVDGRSFNIIAHELGALYRARRTGAPAALAPPLSYAQFAVNQLDTPRDPDVDAYWRGVFSTRPADLDLPYDRPRPALRSFNNARVTAELGADLHAALKKASAAQGCTLFATLFTAFQVFMGRLGNTNDVVVATPTVNQDDVRDGALVGHTVNLLAIRSAFDAAASFKEALKATSRNILDAVEHRALTFGSLVSALKLPRKADRAPLAELQFNVERRPSAPDFGEITASVSPNSKAFANFTFTCNFLESDAGLRIDCNYNADMFDAGTIDRWVDGLRTLLAYLAADMDQQIATAPTQDTAQTAWLLDALNDTAVDFPRDKLVHELISAQAEKTPDAMAATFAAQSISYRALDQRSNQIANRIRDIVPGAGGRIAVAVERSLDMLAVLIAVMKAGHAYVPLDLSHPQARLEQTIAAADVAAVICDNAADAAFAPAGVAIFDLSAEQYAIARASSEALATAPRDSERAAYVIFTSGSTGVPKGVAVPHRAVVNFLLSMQKKPGFAANDVLLAVTTISFDIAGLELYLPLISGGRVVIANREAVRGGFALVDLIDSAGVTVLQATPSLWRLLLEAGFAPRATVKMLCGGEALPRDLADRLLAGGAGELWNMYGPTETTIWSSCCRVEANGPITIGAPIDNTGLYILDDRDQLAALGVPGHLYIGGDGLALGYFNRDDLTQDAYRLIALEGRAPQRLYKTGDLGRRLPDGNIQLFGRSDHQIKLRGFRIEVEEIESVMRQAPGVAAAAVALRGESGAERLVGYVVPEAGSELDAVALRAFVAARLADYMVPSAWKAIDALPLNTNGKLDRRALPAPDGEIVSARAIISPRTPAEIAIAAICAEILQIHGLSVDDNLFALGADSLSLFRIVARLNDPRIEARHILTNPTVAALAALIEDDASRQPAADASALKIRSLGDYKGGARRNMAKYSQ